MKTILSKLFEKSIELGDEVYSEEQIQSKWLGNASSTLDEIRRAEERLQIELPEDYKEMLLLANGFPTSNNSVEPSFLDVNKIDYYRNYEWNAIDGWVEILPELSNSIMIAGREEEQQFLLIPPSAESDKWKYWKFANWIPGEEAYEDLTSYFERVIDLLELLIKEKRK